MKTSCAVKGCPGDWKNSWKKPTPLSFFRVPSIITCNNNRFSGYGQEERKKRVIELSRKRRKAWLSLIKRENAHDRQPADLEDEENPDWLPSLKLGDDTSTIDKTKTASLDEYNQRKLDEKKAEAVKLYGGSSDPPVFIETEEIEPVLVLKTDDESNPEEIVIADFDPLTYAHENSKETDDVPIETEGKGDDNNPVLMNTATEGRSEEFGHWHVQFCTKKACLYSKAAVKRFSADAHGGEDD